MAVDRTCGLARFNAVLAGLRALAYLMDRRNTGRLDLREQDILHIAMDGGGLSSAHDVERLGDHLNDNRLLLTIEVNDGTRPEYQPALTFAEWQTVAHDLRTAADQYTTDARKALEDQPANHRIAEQFITQAQRSIKLAERIEESAGV